MVYVFLYQVCDDVPNCLTDSSPTYLGVDSWQVLIHRFRNQCIGVLAWTGVMIFRACSLREVRACISVGVIVVSVRVRDIVWVRVSLVSLVVIVRFYIVGDWCFSKGPGPCFSVLSSLTSVVVIWLIVDVFSLLIFFRSSRGDSGTVQMLQLFWPIPAITTGPSWLGAPEINPITMISIVSGRIRILTLYQIQVEWQLWSVKSSNQAERWWSIHRIRLHRSPIDNHQRASATHVTDLPIRNPTNPAINKAAATPNPTPIHFKVTENTTTDPYILSAALTQSSVVRVLLYLHFVAPISLA